MGTSTTSTPSGRKKHHKGGKYLSLSVWLSCLGIVLLLVAAQSVRYFTTPRNTALVVTEEAIAVQLGVASQLEQAAAVEAPMAAAAPPRESTPADNLSQPIAPKVEFTQEANTGHDYSKIWMRLNGLADTYALRDESNVVTPETRADFINEFLAGFNYKARKTNGPIVSLVSGDQISPETLHCYLNGYVPDKPYIKPNCPTY